MTSPCIKYWSEWQRFIISLPADASQGRGHERAMDRRTLVYVERVLYFLHLFSGTVIGLPVDYSREVTILFLFTFYLDLLSFVVLILESIFFHKWCFSIIYR